MVLLVSHDPDVILLVEELLIASSLREKEFILKTKPSFEDAKLFLEDQNEVDVVLLDLGIDEIKEISGGEIDHFIESILKHHFPFIFLASHHDENLALKGVREGAQDFLFKSELSSSNLTRSILYSMERFHLLHLYEAMSEERLGRLVDQNKDPIIVISQENIVLYLNLAAKKLYNEEHHNLLSKKFRLPSSAVCKLDGRILNQESLYKTIADSGVVTCVALEGTTGNTELEYELHTETVKWVNSDAYVLTFHDITDLKKIEGLEEEINERDKLDKMKDDFISAVSHELRTPLTIVKGAIDNLIDGIAGELSEKQSRVMGIAHKNVDRLARLINDLLDLSRLESGNARIHKVEIDFHEVVSEIQESYERVMREKNLDFKVEEGSNLPKAFADRDMMFQLLDNLLQNAIRYTDSKVSIKVAECEYDPEPTELVSRYIRNEKRGLQSIPGKVKGLQITVKDDGKGIPIENQKDLFNKFVQVNRPMGGSGYKGTGLGLAICKEIIDLHFGRIWVESEPEKWCAFHFMIPCSEQKEALDIL